MNNSYLLGSIAVLAAKKVQVFGSLFKKSESLLQKQMQSLQRWKWG